MPRFPKSLPRICVALGFPSASQLIQAAEREYKDGNTFLEFRLDHLPDSESGIRAIRSFRKKYADAQILATCRHRLNHGVFKGSIDQQVRILEAAAKSGSAAVDLEIESAERVCSALSALRSAAALIVSYHNFESTPALGHVLRRLQRIPADAYKVAVTARKPTDNFRIVEFARNHQKLPLVAFAMSEVGFATRVLAPSLGCLFTYGAPGDNAGTAPGQIQASLMHSLYRCEKLGRDTRIYGVVADPVAHSKSPAIHNRAFQCRRIDAVYLPFRVERTQLGDWMKMAAGLPVAGFSVTIPHKQKILAHLDAVDPLAKRIGAVNTVWRRAGKWRGANTDAQGVLQPLSRRIRLPHASILIAGYGGAARSAAIALSDAGARVTITGRNLKSAQALARAAKAQTISLGEASSRHFDALVHATPVGMSPQSEDCLFDHRIPAVVVFDMVYNPAQTLLLKRAAEQGLEVIPGSEMLIEQAACQFEIWTGESAPRAAMQDALARHG
ncbi:MAG: shikimate dehydrogenase [Acidobacteriaceae bacterium]|nr:shikimate dehydrogenase [Acidobacteriaceae bacterium]